MSHGIDISGAVDEFFKEVRASHPDLLESMSPGQLQLLNDAYVSGISHVFHFLSALGKESKEHNFSPTERAEYVAFQMKLATAEVRISLLQAVGYWGAQKMAKR